MLWLPGRELSFLNMFELLGERVSICGSGVWTESGEAAKES